MKKSTKILCALAGIGFLATGCATVGNIKNNETDILYNGIAAVMVSDNLYYANSISDLDFKDDKDYKNDAKTSYLARLNTAIETSAKNRDYSPKNVEKVEEEVVGQTHSFTFALGNYVYYATPKRKESSNDDNRPEKHYDYTTLYRSQLNGDKKTEILMTNGVVSKIEVLKFDGKYYIVIYDGSTLYRVCIGNSAKAEKKQLKKIEDVTSVAIPKTYQKDNVSSSLDWNGTIYFTIAKKDEDNTDVKGTYLKRIDINKDEMSDEEMTMEGYEDTFTLVGREQDQVFFTLPNEENTTITYCADLSQNGKYDFRNNKKEFSRESVSNFILISTKTATQTLKLGYLYQVSSTYKFAKPNGDSFDERTITFEVPSTEGDPSTLSGANLLAVVGQKMYFSTATQILSADISSVVDANTKEVTITCNVLAEMKNIYSGTISAIDKNYIYFYAELEDVEAEDDEESEETEEEVDTNFYLYRARLATTSGATKETNHELLSLTKSESRRTK